MITCSGDVVVVCVVCIVERLVSEYLILARQAVLESKTVSQTVVHIIPRAHGPRECHLSISIEEVGKVIHVG